MLGFSRMLRAGLEQVGQQVEELWPRPFFNRIARLPPKIRKWLAYADKYLLFPNTLRRHLRENSSDVTHICDHSNSIYLPHLGRCPHLVTCHDVMAIRSAMEHFPGIRIGSMGKKLQRRILGALRTTDQVTCDSENSRQDLLRLAPELDRKSNVAHLGFNQPMAPVDKHTAASVLRSAIPSFDAPFLLHVGNDAWYKNRSGMLRIFATFRKRYGKPVRLVLVGPPLNQKQRALAASEGFLDDVVNAESISDEILQALYSTALALVFPSLYEGFGWPPLEAQACGCPVVASPRGSLSEILGDSGILVDPENQEAYADALMELVDNTSFRQREIERGHANAKRFDIREMVDTYLFTYRKVLERTTRDP